MTNTDNSTVEIDDFDDDGFTEMEFDSLKTSLKEAAMIERGELRRLSMNDLWDE